jgi:hypothetical protein
MGGARFGDPFLEVEGFCQSLFWQAPLCVVGEQHAADHGALHLPVSSVELP